MVYLPTFSWFFSNQFVVGKYIKYIIHGASGNGSLPVIFAFSTMWAKVVRNWIVYRTCLQAFSRDVGQQKLSHVFTNTVTALSAFRPTGHPETLYKSSTRIRPFLGAPPLSPAFLYNIHPYSKTKFDQFLFESTGNHVYRINLDIDFLLVESMELLHLTTSLVSFTEEQPFI